MSAINFGGAGNSQQLFGLLSGLNSGAIIEAAVAARSQPIGDLVVQSSELGGKIAALKSLKGILANISDLADSLRNPIGVNNDDENAFRFRNSTVTGNPTGFDAASDLLSVTANPGAQEANYDIEITQLAQNEIELLEGFGTLTGDLTDGNSAAEVVPGTFQINGVDVTITEGATLSDVRNAINAVSDDTGVTANIITITPESEDGADDGVYQLQLVGDSTGASNSIEFTDFTTVFQASGGVTVTQTQQALDASINFNGTTISRSTNQIDDVIDNVTFNLLNSEVGTTLNVDITSDTSVPQSQITNFVAGINQFLIFASEQQARDPITGEPLASALLGDSPLLRSLVSQIQSEIRNSVAGVDSSFDSLSDIGFAIELFEGEEVQGDPNTPLTSLLTDNGTLSSQLINNFEDIEDLFGLQFSTTGANDILSLASATNDFTLNDFTISIDITQAEGERVSVTTSSGTFFATFEPYDDDDLTAGGTIIGIDGTELEGARFVYTGDGTDSNISATASHGVAHRIFNLLDSYTETLGIIDTQILELEDTIQDNDQAITDLNNDLEVYRARLTEQFSRIEGQINEANATLTFLESFAAAQNASG